MKNTHKSKVYRFDAKMTKISYQKLKQYFLESKFENVQETKKFIEKQQYQAYINGEENNNKIFHYEKQLSLYNYLIESYVTDSSLHSKLNKIDSFINQFQKSGKEQVQKNEKSNKNSSQITEIQV